MSCSDLYGIEIHDAKASLMQGFIRVSFEVYNNSPKPLYLFNINNPLVERKGELLYMYFNMVDTSGSLILREVPFSSNVKRIDSGEVFSFLFEVGFSQKFEKPDLSGTVGVGDIDNLVKITVSLGYSYEDIYFMNTGGGEKELTGGEAIKVRTDEGIQDIRVLNKAKLSNLSHEDFITLLDVQNIIDFQVVIER